MKYALVFSLLLLTNVAVATGDKHGHNHQHHNSDIDNRVSVEASPRISNHVSSPSTATAVVEQGAIAAHGGTATGGSVGNIGGASAVGGDVSVTTKTSRQAPSVYLNQANNTMDCAKTFGIGGSGTGGSGVVGWTWLARDCYAQMQFAQLAALGLHIPAARAFCSRKLHWFPFESEENCRAEVAQSLIAIEMDRQEVRYLKKHLPSVSPLQRWMQELPPQ